MSNYERRTRLAQPHFPESLPELVLGKRMYEQKGVYFLNQPDLHHIMRQSVICFEDEVQQIQGKDKAARKMRKYVYFVEGIPGSGKTYTVNNLVLPYLNAASERMRKRYGIDVQVRYLQWDHVEDALIEDNVINPVRGQPFKPLELRIVGSFLKLLTAYHLRDDEQIPLQDIKSLFIDSSLIRAYPDETETELMGRLSNVFQNLLKKFSLQKNEQSPYTLLVVEKCGATAIKTKKGSLGEKRIWTPPRKEYFPDMLDDLHHQETPFTGINRNSIFTTAIGCVGGPSMEVLIRSRDLMKTIRLDEANMLYAQLGLKQLHEEHKKLAGHGGSMAQIAAARDQIWPQLLYMPTDANNVHEIVSSLPLYIRDVISLKRSPPMGFPDSVWDDPQGKELVWQSLELSKLFQSGDDDTQTYHAEDIFLKGCFRLAEAPLLKNNLLGDVNCGTVILNNPPFKLTEASRGILAKRYY